MRSINKYQEFLLESILYTSSQLKDILKSIDDLVAKDFIKLVDQDINTQFNGLNTTDKNDTISFTPDNQFQRKIDSGSKLEDLLKMDSNKTSIGRLIQKILKDNGKEYTSNQITEFTDKFKAAYTKYFSKEESSPIRVIEGEEIRKWYNEIVYSRETSNGKGTLGRSCMRYEECQHYFNIYTKNPDVCKMVINTTIENSDEKLLSRALLWETNEGWYLDRIYFTDASEKILIKEFVDKNFDIVYSYDFTGVVPKLSVDLSSSIKDYGLYPYMDSFPYYHKKDGKLFNYEPTVSDKSNLFMIQNTNGEAEPMDLVYCDITGEGIPSDEAIWSEYHGTYLHIDDSVYSNYYASEIYEPRSHYSVTLSDHIPSDDANEVYIDLDGTIDFLPSDYDDIKYEEEDGGYYLSKLLVKIGGKYYLESNLIKGFKISQESKLDFCRIFNMDKDIDLDKCICSLSTKEFFGFKGVEIKEKIPYKEYVRNTYKYVIFDILEKKIEELSKDDDYIEDIRIEIDDAKYWLLGAFDMTTKSINYAYSIGGKDQLLKLYFTFTNNHLDSIIQISFLSTNSFKLIPNTKLPKYYSSIFNIVKKVVKDHLIEYCEGTTKVTNLNPEYDLDKLKSIIDIIEGIPDYDKLKLIVPNIEYVILSFIRSVISTTLNRLNTSEGYSVKTMSIRYFLDNPNIFDKLEYNP